MTDQLDARISVLEDAYEIEQLMNRHVRHFDSVVNGRPDTLDASLFLPQYQWHCKLFGSYVGFEGYARFLEVYSRRVSFSLQLLGQLGIDADSARTSGRGRWSVWQPFTLEGEAWVLAGQYECTFVRDEVWRLATTDLHVDILVAWSLGWADERVSPKWTW